MKDAEDCPITGLSLTSSGYSSSYATGDGSGTTMYSRTEYSGEMPINAIQIFLSASNRGSCYGLGAGQGNYDGSGKSLAYTNQYPDTCKKSDTRFQILDSLGEEEYLGNHFENEAACTGATVTDDYIATGTVCDASPFTSSECMV